MFLLYLYYMDVRLSTTMKHAIGLSRQEMLAREFIVCDALYAECQRPVGSPGQV